MSAKTTIVLAALAAFFVAACGGSSEGPVAPTSTPASVATSAPTATAAAPSPTSAPQQAATPVPPAATAPSPPPPPPPPPPPAPAPPAPAPPPQSAAPPAPVTLQVTAQNIAFDKTELHARAGASVTAVLTNQDATVDHNLTFSVPGLGHGETCKGPCTVSQTFTAPAAGRYDFFCNIHSNMIGTFIVDP